MIAIFPKIAECAAEGDVEKLGCMVRKYFARSEAFSPKLDVKSIYGDLGIPIFQSELKGGAAALTCTDSGGQFSVSAIIAANTQRACQQNFILGHLLGHFLLHIQPKILRGEWHTSGLLIDGNPEENYASSRSLPEKDALASRFAAALLMPLSFVIRAKEKMPQTEQLAGFFGVSPEVMKKRLRELSVKSEQDPKASPPPQQEESNQTSGSIKKGMERIREIARSMDKRL